MYDKYGIYQASSKSCVFYKQDEDGNQSTFNIFVTTLKDEQDRKRVFAYIDNDQINQDHWIFTKEADIKDSWLALDKLKHFTTAMYLTTTSFYVQSRIFDLDRSRANSITLTVSCCFGF